MMILGLVRITSRPISGWSRVAGTSPTAWPAPTTSEGWRSGHGGRWTHRTAVLRRLKPFDVNLHYTIGIGCPATVEES